MTFVPTLHLWPEDTKYLLINALVTFQFICEAPQKKELSISPRLWLRA